MSHYFNTELDQLIAMLTAKGMLEATATLQFSGSDGYTPVRLEFDYKISPNGSRTYKTIRPFQIVEWLNGLAGRGDGASEPMVSDYFDLAREMIEKLPTVRELRVKEFVNQVEAIKAAAEDLELDIDFVNPLAALMEKLATNALPSK